MKAYPAVVRVRRRRTHSLERLEPRIAPAVTVVRTGNAPNFTVTFSDDGTTPVDNYLVLQVSPGSLNLEFSINGSAFTSDLGGGNTATFANIGNIVVQLSDGDGDALGINLQALGFDVTTNPDFDTPLRTNVDLKDTGSSHTVHLGLTGGEVLNLIGSGDNDSLGLATGEGDSVARVQSSAFVFTDEFTASDYSVRVDFSHLKSFTYAPSGIGTNVITFAARDLVGAASYTAAGLSSEDLVVIEGSYGSDAFTMMRPNASTTRITGGSLLPIVVASSAFPGSPSIRVDALGGDDTFNIDVGAAAGSDFITNPITFDGGTGYDRLFVSGAPTTVTSTAWYQPGINSGDATLNYSGYTSSMSVGMLHTEEAADLVTAAELTINGTNSADAIDYAPGDYAGGFGHFIIGSAGVLYFANKTSLLINGNGGDDTITFATPPIASGLTSVTVVDGFFLSLPSGVIDSGRDTVKIMGSDGSEQFTVTPSAPHTATVLGPGAPIAVYGIRTLVIDGQGGDDHLFVNTTAGNDLTTVVPGVPKDAGTVLVNDLLPVNFMNIGANGSLTISNPGGQDVLDYAGTTDSDLFSVASNTGTITLGTRGLNGSFLPGSQHIPVSIMGIQTLRLHGLGGNDLFQLGSRLPYTGGVITDGGADQVNASSLFGTGQAFTAPSNFDVGKRPVAIAAGDLNGDGFIDLVTANSSANTVNVLLGDGHGGFQGAASFPTGGKGARGLVLGQFDTGGTLDIAVTNSISGNISVLLGNGDGTFNPATLTKVGVKPGVLRAADLDGDGKLDLTTLVGTKIATLKGGGDGTFAAPKFLATKGLAPVDLLVTVSTRTCCPTSSPPTAAART